MGGESASEVSRILRAAETGAPVDLGALFPLVYEQLRRIAGRQMKGERGGHTLQATALVHEAFIRLLGTEKLAWRSRTHFYGAAAKAMRRILIDHARAKGRQKRGGSYRRVAVTLADLVSEADPAEFLAVDEALCRLKEVAPRAGEIADLRLYAGLTVPEVADGLGLSVRTVERDWSYARAWLFDSLR